MDESEREIKRKAGREKFEQYRKKKEKEKSKNAQTKEKDCLSASQESRSAAVNETISSTSPDSSQIVNTEYYASSEDDDDTVEVVENKDVPKDAFSSDQNSIEFSSSMKEDVSGNSSALDQSSETNASEDDIDKLNGHIINARIIENANKIQEYELQLATKNSLITQLTDSLKVTINQRDTLQVDAAKQAEGLVKEIETLKLQMQNAREFLKNQRGKDGVSEAELLETKNRVIALSQERVDNINTMETLSHQNADLNAKLHQLQSDYHNGLKIKEKEVLLLQTENDHLKKSLQDLIVTNENVAKLLNIKEDEILRNYQNLQVLEKNIQDSNSEIAILQNGRTAISEELEDLRTFFKTQKHEFNQKNSENMVTINELQSFLEISKNEMENYKELSTQENNSLKENIKELQIQISDWPNRLLNQKEDFESRFLEIKNKMSMSHQMEVNDLNEKIHTFKLELEHLQIKTMETETFDSQSKIIEQLQLEIQTKNLTIDEYSEKLKAMESNIEEYNELKIKLDESMSEKTAIEANLLEAKNELQEVNNELKIVETNFKRDRETLNGFKEELNEKNIQIEKLNNSIRDYMNNETTLVSERNYIRDRTESIEASFNTIEKKFSGDLEGLNTRLETLKFDVMKLEILQRKNADLLSQIATLKHEKQLTEDCKTDIEKQLVDVTIQLQQTSDAFQILKLGNENHEKLIVELKILLEDSKTEKHKLSMDCEELKNKFDTIESIQSNKFKEDFDILTEKYEKLLQEKVESEMELPTSEIDTGITDDYSNDTHIGSSHEESNKNEKSQIDCLVDIVSNLLNKIENEKIENLGNTFIIKELHSLKSQLTNIKDVVILQQELGYAINQHEMQNIQIKLVKPLENEEISKKIEDYYILKAELERAENEKLNILSEFNKLREEFENLKSKNTLTDNTSGFDKVNWEEKYNLLLQEKLELEIELQTVHSDTGIIREKTYIYDGDNFQSMNSDNFLKTISKHECTLKKILKLVDNLVIQIENKSFVDLEFLVQDLQICRDHLKDSLQDELKETVNQIEEETIHVTINPPLGNSETSDQIETLKLELEKTSKEKFKILDDYEILKLELDSLKNKKIKYVQCAEVQVDNEEENSWRKKYDQLLQEKVELEINLSTSSTVLSRDSLLSFEISGDATKTADKLTSASQVDGKPVNLSAKFESRVNKLVNLLDQVRNKIETETRCDLSSVVLDIYHIRELLLSVSTVDILKADLESTVDEEEKKNIKVKKVHFLDNDNQECRLENVKRDLEEVLKDNQKITAEYSFLKEKYNHLLEKQNIKDIEIQVDFNDLKQWEEKYKVLLEEKIKLEEELHINYADTGITRRSAYLCGADEIEEKHDSRLLLSSNNVVNVACAKYESSASKLIKMVDHLLKTFESHETSDLDRAVFELRVVRDSIMNFNTIESLQRELENAIQQEEEKSLQTKRVLPLGDDNFNQEQSDDAIRCECIEVGGNDLLSKKFENVLSNQSQVDQEDESLKLKQKIAYLENQLAEKDNDLVRIRQDLQIQYEEDVEHVRQCFENSLAQEVQADVEAEVDELKEKVDADIRARNVENARLCNDLQELKVLVQQLQKDKQKLEESLGSGEGVQLDDIQMNFDEVQSSFLTLGSMSNDDKWEARISEERVDLKLPYDHVCRLLSYLLGVYANIGKSINKELITLIGKDLDLGDISTAVDRSIQFPECNTEEANYNECSILSIEDGVNNDMYENIVLETGSKLNVAVQRLLGILSALMQQLQETQRSSTSFNENSQVLFEDSNEDLEAQLSAETRSKEFLGVELHRISNLLKVAEDEKLYLKGALIRKEKLLSEVTCQLEETKAQSQKLEECLTENDLHSSFQQEFNTDSLGEGGQILRSLPVENQSYQLAADGTELLDENARLQREKRGLQHRVERERTELTAQIRELEHLLEETSSAQEAQLEIKRREIADFQQQIDALEFKLRGYKNFIDEQTLDREQEREDHQRQLNKMQEVIREKDRAQNSEERLTREVETWQEQLKEKNDSFELMIEKKEQLEKELNLLLEKSNSDQDTIRDLERQLDCKSRNEKFLTEQVGKIQSELSMTSLVHHDQSMEIEQLRKMSISSPLSVSTAFFEEYFGSGHFDMENPPSPESVVIELRSQVQNLEEKLGRHSLDLEGLLVVTSCLSSPCSEEVSVKEVLRNKETDLTAKNEAVVEPSFGAFLKDIRRLEDKVENLSRSKDIVLKRLKDYEAQIVKQRQTEEELLQDRDLLQQKVNAQLLQITSLQARIEKRRFGFEDDEALEKVQELEDQLRNERHLVDCKVKQIEELQENLISMEKQYNSYKKQVFDLTQRYNGDVNQHKIIQTEINAKLNEAKQINDQLKNDLLLTHKQSEDVSSILQTVMLEKNKEIDMISSEVQILRNENDDFKKTNETLEIKLFNSTKLQQELSNALDKLEIMTEEILDKDNKLIDVEREWKKCLEIIEHKRREVDALKVVLEEKAQLVEQVLTLKSELVDVNLYQARLQEDFDTLQSILEERHAELASAHQEVSDLNLLKEEYNKEKVNLQIELEVLQQRLDAPKEDFEVQVELYEDQKKILDEQNLKIQSLQAELEIFKDSNEKLKVEEKKVSSLTKNLKALKIKLNDSEESTKTLSTELDKSNSDLKQIKEELNQTLQLKLRLEAEIALRDTKIFRIEDELEQIKMTKENAESTSGKASLYKFLEEVRQEVLRESDNLLHNEERDDSSDGFSEHLKGKKVNLRDDVRQQSISSSVSVSSSDVESVTSEQLPVPVRSLMRKVYKEGIHVLNLSELESVKEQVPTDAPMEDFNKTFKYKNWENEKKHLIAEVEALKELLTHVTNVATVKSVDSQAPFVPEILRNVLKLMSNDRSIIIEKLIGNSKNPLNEGKLERCVTELIEMYANLTRNIQSIVSNMKHNPINNTDLTAIAWEVQIAVAKERLINQNEQKRLLNQLQTLEQQLCSRERQLKRQADLLEFRVQQEQLISEDLRRNLEMEKSRCIELCGQLALEKNRVTHMDLAVAQLKAELSNSKLILEQDKQELNTTLQQLKNEKATVESYVQALQTQRENFLQLQEAMEAEKRRSKSSCQRDQQIKEELRQALIAERDRQLELTTLLESERLALQNARHDLLRAQNRNSSSLLEKRESVTSQSESIEDSNNGLLILEKIKNQDMATALQKEQHKVAVLTSALQQDRKQLLDELDSTKENCSRLQSKLENSEAQKANLVKEVQRNKEDVHRLEMECDKLCNELSGAQNNIYQKDQEMEQFRRIQRETNKDFEIERELERQKLQEFKLEMCKLQQIISNLEREKELMRRSDNLVEGDVYFNRYTTLSSNAILHSDIGLSRFQITNLETLRQRIFLLTLKIMENINNYLKSDINNPDVFETFSLAVKSVLAELCSLGQELQASIRAEEGLSVHLDLMEKVVKLNAELAEFALRLSEEKLALRESLMQDKNELNLLKWNQGTSSSHSLTSNTAVLAAERASWAQERTRLQQALHKAEADLIRASSRQSHLNSPAIDQIDDNKIIWQKYLRAESFRKNLVFQKTYLLLILAGYQYTESGTLEMLGRLGCLMTPRSNTQNEYRHSKAFQRFRSAARLIGAIFRMKFLVRRWRRYEGSILNLCTTPVCENSHDRFSITSSNSCTPSAHSQTHRFSLNAGYTPPVKDGSRNRLMDEKSSVCRNLPFASASISSSGSSNASVNGKLSEYVRRFENIQQQLGIVSRESQTSEK